MLEKMKFLCENERIAGCYDELIQLFIAVTYKSSAAYASATFIYVWFLHPFIPLSYLIPWAIFQFLYPLLRLYLAYYYKKMPLTREIKLKFQYQHMFLGLLGGLMWGAGSILCVHYAPSPYEYMLLALIIGLSAGSLSTLSPLYHVYLAYNLPSLLLLMISFLFYSDSLHFAIAFMILIFTVIVPSATWDVHNNFKKSVELNKLYAASQEQLKQLNASLEEKVQEEVEHNRLKDQQMLAQSRLAQMGEMLSMIAHQWRQPLSAIAATTGSISLHIQLEEFNERFVEQNIQKINTYTQYLSRTISDFRNFFKPNKERSLSSFNSVVHDSLKIIGPSLESQGVVLDVHLNSDAEFMSYPNELNQVVLNILKNAQDIFVEKNIQMPKIVIETQSLEDESTLTITDNGGGILKENMEFIFDPYFTTKHQSDGTGLGLYMSKMIVEDHCGGKLSVENRGEGACFILIHPHEIG